ncbi:oligosaccharide flippase family protein, partial [Klebsiella pneumoniae]|nr:oligosaccharide flippase family protein [Klebsiella pneumoniae]
AMASVVMNLANVFNDMGTGAAVIQRENPSQGFYNYIYKINLTTGFLIMVVVIITSPLIVFYFNHVDLYPILFLLALSFPISSVSIVHKAKLEKQMLFKTVVKIEALASLTAMIVAVVLANLDFGVYS